MTDILTTHAHNQGAEVAVVDDRGDGDVTTLTWAELEARSNQLARVLADHGVEPGTKIVWCGQNSIGVVELINASRKLGATAVPLNYRLSDDEAAYVVDHCDGRIVYTDVAYAPLFERIRDSIPNVEQILVFGGEAPADMVAVDGLIQDADTSELSTGAEDGAEAATMIYTSGTTGKPKGALRYNQGTPESRIALLGLIGYRADDIYMTTGPLYHSGPAGFMGIALVLGQTIVLQHKFDPEDWLRLVDSYQVTTTFSAPTPIRMICNVADDIKARYDRSSMRVMIANAAPWTFALKQQYLADFPAESLFEVYGSTELGVNTVLEPADQLRKPGSCGKPAPMVEIRLYDDDGNIVTGTGPEATGELYVRSSAVFADYYKQTDKYQEDHRDGFQTVGDIAYRDDEGFIYICDRKKDMIISGGMNIYPAEIEAALESHPDVFEAAVFGIPNEDWGESVHAVIVARDGASLDDAEVDRHARANLAGYKVPRSIDWTDELPKTGSGKVLKRDLRKPYWSQA